MYSILALIDELTDAKPSKGTNRINDLSAREAVCKTFGNKETPSDSKCFVFPRNTPKIKKQRKTKKGKKSH